MKKLTITLSHGRIWAVETSSGVRATGATLESALDKLVPHKLTGAFGFKFEDIEQPWLGIKVLMETIPDSGGDGNIGRGVSAG